MFRNFYFQEGNNNLLHKSKNKKKEQPFFFGQLRFSSSVSLGKNGHIANYCAISG